MVIRPRYCCQYDKVFLWLKCLKWKPVIWILTHPLSVSHSVGLSQIEVNMQRIVNFYSTLGWNQKCLVSKCLISPFLFRLRREQRCQFCLIFWVGEWQHMGKLMRAVHKGLPADRHWKYYIFLHLSGSIHSWNRERARERERLELQLKNKANDQ